MVTLITGITWQISWWALILTAGTPWIHLTEVLSALMMVGCAYWAWRSYPSMKQTMPIALVGALIGDGLLLATGCIEYQGQFLPWLPPIWIHLLWLWLALGMSICLVKWSQYVLLWIMFGAVSGPLAYYGASQFDAITLVQFGAAIIGTGLLYGMSVPILAYVTKRVHHA